MNNNYLSQIEDEYSRVRGRASFLTPIDWQLAAKWEENRVPLHIVLNAMADVAKKFKEYGRKDSINSLKYFAQEVEKQNAEWQTSQIGKSETAVTQNFVEEIAVENEVIEDFLTCTAGDIENLEDMLAQFKRALPQLPEPLASAIAETIGSLSELIQQAKDKVISTDDAETDLHKLVASLEIPLALSISESERAEMLAAVQKEYSNLHLNDESRQKILVKKLFTRFNLPEMTLFPF